MDTSKGKLYTALQDEKDFYVVNIERNVSMKTRDGVNLRSDVYRPTPKTPEEKFPVLLSTRLLIFDHFNLQFELRTTKISIVANTLPSLKRIIFLSVVTL